MTSGDEMFSEAGAAFWGTSAPDSEGWGQLQKSPFGGWSLEKIIIFEIISKQKHSHLSRRMLAPNSALCTRLAMVAHLCGS